jgi:2,4-dienoyl-CoA reductase-like NADH-dependent reductase (Old Yellow Enzyme family)
VTVGSVSLDLDFITSFAQQPTKTEAANIDRLMEMMARGDFDLVAVGRALIVNPDWANKVREGLSHELKPYTPESLGIYF